MAPTAGRTALAVLLLPLLYTEGFLPGGCRALSRHAGSATATAAAPRRAQMQMKLDLTGGSYVALVTPMDAAGAIDEPCLRALLRWHLESGTDGLVVLGTTGEASTLSTEERGRVLQVTQEEVAGKIPVVVGTGGISPQQVIAHTRAAADAGADGCLIVTPYYVKPTQAGLVKFFTTVADAAPLPMVLYNVPGRTGVDMQTAAVAECARHPGIVGMKEATGDNSRVAPLLEACGPDFLLYSGDDGGGCEFVLKGGHGVISVTANIAPARMAQVMAAARAGRTDEANELNEPLQLLHQRLFLASNPIPAKWALKRMGRINTGALRLPLTELETQHHAPLEEGLRAAGLL